LKPDCRRRHAGGPALVCTYAGGGRPYATLSVETVGRSTQVAVARPLSVLWKINDDGFSPTPSVDGACRRNEKLYYREPCRSRVCLHAVGSSKTEDRLCYAVFTLGMVELCAKNLQIMRNDFTDYARTFCQLCAPFSVLYYT